MKVNDIIKENMLTDNDKFALKELNDGVFLLVDKSSNKKYQINLKTGRIADEQDNEVSFVNVFQKFPELKAILKGRDIISDVSDNLFDNEIGELIPDRLADIVAAAPEVRSNVDQRRLWNNVKELYTEYGSRYFNETMEMLEYLAKYDKEFLRKFLSSVEPGDEDRHEAAQNLVNQHNLNVNIPQEE